MHRRAAELTPLEHRIWGDIGDTYTQMGESKEAEAAFYRARDLAESAQQIAPDHAFVPGHPMLTPPGTQRPERQD